MSIDTEMQELMARWVHCFSSGDIEGAAALFCDDGAIYSPYGPAAIGRDAVRATHEAWSAAGEMNKTITVIRSEARGGLAYCLAAYSGDYPQDDGTLLNECGTSLNIAKRQDNGTWKFLISSLNSDKPPLAPPVK